MESHSLLNSEPLSTLEKEFQCCHLRLKCVSKSNIDHLFSLGFIHSRFKNFTLTPCLSCLLEENHTKPWHTKGDHNHARPSHSIAPSSSVCMDHLTSNFPGIKSQHTRRLTNAPIIGYQVFADNSSYPPFH